jgi:hypothetical protein
MGVKFINPFMVSPSLIYIAAQQNTNGGATAVTSMVCNLPSGIVSGDLLIVVLGRSGIAGTVTWPAGWTEIEDQATIRPLAYAYRIADGTEGSTITVTSSNSRTFSAMAFLIKNHASSTSAPVDGTSATGTSTDANPPSVTPSWGSTVNTLYIAVAAWDNNTSMSSYPANYTQLTAVFNGTNRVLLVAAYRVLKGSPEDPGNFVHTVSGAWRTNTIAVRGLT